MLNYLAWDIGDPLTTIIEISLSPQRPCHYIIYSSNASRDYYIHKSQIFQIDRGSSISLFTKYIYYTM
jgi:hypothetical protein